MTPTNTDYLLQVTTPVPDRAYSPAVSNGGSDRFNSLLSQASTYRADDSRNANSSSQRVDANRYDDHPWNGNSSDSNTAAASSSSSQQPSTSCPDDADQVSGPATTSEQQDDDDHETDDTTAAEAAGATQVSKDGQKSPAKSESNGDATVSANAKASDQNKKVPANGAKQNTTGLPAEQLGDSALAPHAPARHSDPTAGTVESSATVTAEVSGQESQELVAEANQADEVKTDASTAKSNKAVNAKTEKDLAKGPAGHGDGEMSGETLSEKINLTAGADPTFAPAASATAKTKGDVEDSSDDDSKNSSKDDGHAAARNDSITTASKLDAAQLAGNISSASEAGADAAAKGKDDAPAAKPIVAKGEPAPAAFARMARNNVSGASETTDGASELPAIDPARFINRVAKAFHSAQDRGGTVQLRLSPPELGAMRIELNVKDGVMSASLQTDNADARKLLLDHLPALRDRLAEQNIRVDRFDVDVRQDGSSGQTDTRGSQQQQFQQQSDQPTQRRQSQPQPSIRGVAPSERTVAASTVSDTGLNLIV